MLSTVNVQIDNINVGSIDSLANVCSSNSKGQSFGQTILTLLLTIQITGYQTLLAKQLRGFLAYIGALLTVQVNLFHNLIVLL